MVRMGAPFNDRLAGAPIRPNRGRWLDIRRWTILGAATGIPPDIPPVVRAEAAPSPWVASTRSSRCVALFLAQPSASTFPTADGQGGRHFPPVDASRPLARASKLLSG